MTNEATNTEALDTLFHQENGRHADIIERLRGKVVVPINDGLGPVDGQEDFFERQFPTSFLAKEAADLIERLREALSQPAAEIRDDGWMPGNTAPMNGKSFQAKNIILTPMRYKPYKADGQRQMGTKGRWQKMNEYGGWENCESGPDEWMYEAARAAISKIKGE